MDLTDSHKLLCDYADRGNESAFQELVNRYIDLVYSTALRRVGGNADTAQDVTQAVFTDLARKAHFLRDVDMLGGWLHRHTGFVASNFVRSEHRRQIREQEAAQMNALADSPDALWQQLSPVLDETIDSLEPADRQAILLRFFERHDFRSIGATLGISDDAAQKRVSRALDKLKDLLARRGVTLSVVLLGSLMAGKVVKAAPADLAIKVGTIALAGVRFVGVTATLAKVANSLPFKIALAAIVVATAVKLILSNHSAPPVETARQGNAGVPAVATQTVSTPASEIQVPVAAPAAQETPPSPASNILALTIVSADSGKPIPNVHLEYFLGVQGESRRKKPLQTTSSGTCEVPVPDGTTELILASQIDGFADTRLKWNPDHGQVIPAQYTLRVAQAVPIGGTVVDPDGNPVAGAHVGFNIQPDPALDARIETDNFGSPSGVTATTDAQGRWQINRIGKGAIHFICGGASHPDYVGTRLILTTWDPIAEKQLLASTHVFSLRHAVAVRGVVQDSNGQPVPGAKVLVGRLHYASSRTTNSQPDGTFFVSDCEPGKNMVTAEAEGYAATTLDVDLADNSAPVQLVLRRGHLLKLKVVDTDGNPVPKASVQFDSDSFNHVNQTAPSPTRAQADFQRSTDQNGLLEWDSAPDGDLTFAASATGYMNSGSIQLRADGTEHLITLQPGLTISGTVTDGTTGQPVPRFRVITGWPENDPSDGSINAQWSDRFWMTFDGGKFEHTYDEPAIVGTSNIEFMFKFDAEGYAPFVTRVVEASERNVLFNVTLTPATSSMVTVLSPNSEPAAGAQIGLAIPGAWLQLIPGGFSDRSKFGSLLKANGQGQFQLPSDPGMTRVIAATPDGYADVQAADLAIQPTIQLQPWGRLEGTCLTNGQPAVNLPLHFQFGANASQTIDCDLTAFKIKTDNEGRFAFPQVPPGNHELVLEKMLGTNDAGYWTTEPLLQVPILSGQTTTVTINIPEIPNNPPPTANR